MINAMGRGWTFTWLEFAVAGGESDVVACVFQGDGLEGSQEGEGGWGEETEGGEEGWEGRGGKEGGRSGRWET